MKFKYQAENKNGQKQKGIVEAATQRMAIDLLTQNGLTVISLKEIKNTAILATLDSLFGGVSAKEFVIFSRQLATLIDSRVPLLNALQSIASQTENSSFAFKISSIIVDIDGGSSFSDALAKHPETFSNFYVNMVKAGEASGTLQKTLNDLADNMEKNYELTAKLKGAMYYPAFILFAMIAVGFLVMTFVMPKLLEILMESSVELPLQTKVLISVSGFLVNYWWAVLIVIFFAVFGIAYYLKTEDGRREFDKIILKIPIIKIILKNVYVSRFSENLATLIQSGLPITTALAITSEVVGNEVYREVVRNATEEIKRGGQIAEIFGQYSDLFPPIVVQMIQVGEQTGRVEFALRKVAEFYIKETDNIVKNFSSLIEPVLMVFLAIGVGLLVSAVLLPIYQVATSIQ
ncbi:MAG TPA: type II secretion system F family protein [Candidatus Moranbacteria bacterium]|nr:type II secretion system F family protein [Candidatus Moranbacteria bacterium]